MKVYQVNLEKNKGGLFSFSEPVKRVSTLKEAQQIVSDFKPDPNADKQYRYYLSIQLFQYKPKFSVKLLHYKFIK